MKKFILLTTSLLLFTACRTIEMPHMNNEGVAQSSESTQTETLYKKSFFGGEIPRTWSQVILGDIPPMPYTENAWIDHEYVMYSIGMDDVAFGDTNWTQVDFTMMKMSDLSRWVEYLQSDSDFTQFVQEWTQETVDGRTADVVTFKTEPDGSVSKGGTGGKMYFIPNAMQEMGLILDKQALGDEEFEKGFQHYIETINFDEFNPNNYRDLGESDLALEVWNTIEASTPIPWMAPQIGTNNDVIHVDDAHVVPAGAMQTAWIESSVDAETYQRVFVANNSRDAIDQALGKKGWQRTLFSDADGPTGTMWGYKKVTNEGTTIVIISAVCISDESQADCSVYKARVEMTSTLEPEADL